MNPNRITIFSNGIADFRRCYRLRKGAPLEISLPVKQAHVADVLASLNVYGHVALISPPGFCPANEAEGTLAIDLDRVLTDLAIRLSGSEVEVEAEGGVVQGTLMGLHAEEQSSGDERIHLQFLVVLTQGGLRKVPLRDMQRLHFQDDAVRSEIDKALRRNARQIKPGSTFVEFAIGTDRDEAEAVVQYTLPAAAWKISYRLRRDGEAFELHGFAVVDNNTDEEWNDFLISVVTGEPITFSTDLAEAKVPRRSHVDIHWARWRSKRRHRPSMSKRMPTVTKLSCTQPKQRHRFQCGVQWRGRVFRADRLRRVC